MRPSEAEIARTVVRGRLPGVLQLDGAFDVASVCHATDRTGRPLLLTRDGDGLSVALDASKNPDAPQVRLSVDDIPPGPEAPSLGRVRLYGRLRRLPTHQADGVVLDFAQSNPSPDLFDVGHGVSIHAIEVERIRIECRSIANDVDIAEYAAAEPDPLHEVEGDLLADIADHHAKEIDCLFRRLLSAAGVTCHDSPRAVRLDRYGFVINIGTPPDGQTRIRWARLEFARAIRDQHDLAHLLHPVLFHHQHPGHD